MSADPAPTPSAASRLDVTVNGQPFAFEAAAEPTVVHLLGALGLADRRVAVEVNGNVVPRADQAEHPVRAGDRVEVVTFVGGG
ncbi:MAG: sulfur carrier protein ThiS [Planctomycetes bacterium]|nr:sulfur carrier protein ThiS [Planctomycetota bacterium]